MASPSESPQLPQLSTPGQLDVDSVLRKYEQRISTLITQNVMLETQLEAAIHDRERLLNHLQQFEGGQLAVVPEPDAGKKA